MRPALPLADKLEKDWDRELFSRKGLATMLGWESQWTFSSKGSRSGYPDRTCARDRILFVELKRALTGRASEDFHRQPTPAQVGWLDRLAAAGGEVYLARPTDLEELALVLSKRWIFLPAAFGLPPALKLDGAPSWTPGSLWIPGVGRADTQPEEQAA